MRTTARFFTFLLAAVLLTLVLLGVTYTPSTEIPEGFLGLHVRVHGIDVRVLAQGSGPDVLLIHGSPGSVEDWKPVMQALQGEAHVVAFDRPGNGGVTGDYSLEHNAQVALEVVAALGMKNVTVVGHSYGGATALAMATHAPANVKAYVILDSATYTPSRKPTPLFHLLMVPALGTGLTRASGTSLAAPRIAAGIIEQFNGRTPPPGFIALRQRIWANPKVTFAIAAETIGAREYLAKQSPRYPSIHAPVRIVAQADAALRRESAEHLQRDIKGSSLRLLSGTGHYVQFEKTAEVVEEIRAAIAGASR